jgi:hypothetical protein
MLPGRLRFGRDSRILVTPGCRLRPRPVSVVMAQGYRDAHGGVRIAQRQARRNAILADQRLLTRTAQGERQSWRGARISMVGKLGFESRRSRSLKPPQGGFLCPKCTASEPPQSSAR